MPVVRRPAAAVLLAALLMTPAPTMAHTADHSPTNLQARIWAVMYASRHHADTTSGVKLPAQTLPPLVGRSQAELVDTTQAFRSGACPSTVMGQITCGYDSAQIAATTG